MIVLEGKAVFEGVAIGTFCRIMISSVKAVM